MSNYWIKNNVNKMNTWSKWINKHIKPPMTNAKTEVFWCGFKNWFPQSLSLYLRWTSCKPRHGDGIDPQTTKRLKYVILWKVSRENDALAPFWRYASLVWIEKCISHPSNRHGPLVGAGLTDDPIAVAWLHQTKPPTSAKLIKTCLSGRLFS